MGRPMTRADLADRLAELVDDDDVLQASVRFLESQRSGGSAGSRLVWHLDLAGRVRAVKIHAGIYRKRSNIPR